MPTIDAMTLMSYLRFVVISPELQTLLEITTADVVNLNMDDCIDAVRTQLCHAW